MAFQVACRDLGMDCDYVAKGQTMDELMMDGAKHGKDVHGFTDEQMQDPALADKLKAAIKQT